MAKSKRPEDHEDVDALLKRLNHPLTNVVEALRKIILSADEAIGEQIKWNSPSFYYTGEMKPFNPKEYKRDIVVINLHKKDLVLLVFPTGSKIKDTSGLLEGNYTDGRKIARFVNVAEAKKSEADLKKIIKEWLTLVDKE